MYQKMRCIRQARILVCRKDIQQIPALCLAFSAVKDKGEAAVLRCANAGRDGCCRPSGLILGGESLAAVNLCPREGGNPSVVMRRQSIEGINDYSTDFHLERGA